jgi:CheY-like chemotaxis protein
VEPLTTGEHIGEDVTPKRVLLVDDNKDAADILAQLVRLEGHVVTVAHTPEHALAILADVDPQVALLDIGLPGMDGYQLGARVLEKFPTCRVIALSGYGLASDRARTARAGFAGHLDKPVDMAKLLELIATA